MKRRAIRLTATVLVAMFTTTAISHAAGHRCDNVKHAVDQAIQPLMAKDGIPGMAVGVLIAGRPCVFNYGVASTRTKKPVTRNTLFEIGSISKTFTATLASYAQVEGHLSLTENTSRYLPSLKGTPFGNVTPLNLGTHTPGGLPLQVPDAILNNDQLLQYLRQWRPTCAPGTCRTYNNISIGTLGLITAKSMSQDFATLEQRLFAQLGMKNSFLTIPASRMPDYAQGYTAQDTPIRMSGGELSAETYGVRTTAGDLLRFLQANMRQIPLNPKLQTAITNTHTGYFHAGPMTQDLIWEQYPYPVALNSLLEGNGTAMIFNATPVTAINPPQKPRSNVWINKTGSTNGFGAYIAFIPQKQSGIILLANKSYPINDRVTAAYQILTTLEK